MINFINCSECKSKLCVVQRYCDPDWVDIVNRKKNQEFYKKGQYLFREGDRVFGLYFIQSGKVKVISTGLNGKEQIVRLANDGHVVGHRGYGSEIYPIGAVALSDTYACFLDNDVLYEAFMNNSRLTYSMMMFYSFELRKTEIRQRLLAQMSIREKIAETLLYIKDNFGLNEEDGSLNVVLSRQEIADIAGTSPEQVARMLTDFQGEKLIFKKAKQILILDEDGLNKIIAAHGKVYGETWEKYVMEVLHLPKSMVSYDVAYKL